MVWIYLTRLEAPLPAAVEQQWLDLLAPAFRAKALRLARWQDRQLSLLGKALLWHAIQTHFRSFGGSLQDLALNAFKRPCFHGADFDFNIAHSGEWVVLAIGRHQQIGIDIEEMRPLVLEEYASIWREDERQSINNAPEQCQHFYNLWTAKEAVLKAMGTGLYTALTDIFLSPAAAHVGHKKWHLDKPIPPPGYSMALATDKNGPFFQQELKWSELLVGTNQPSTIIVL